MPRSPDDYDPDDQEGAEALDETELTEDGEGIANFDELEAVFDATEAEGDADDELEDEDTEDLLAAARDAPDTGENDEETAESPEDRSPRTRLETEPDDTGQLAGLDDDETESLASDADIDAGTDPLDADAVTTEDRNKPNRFEPRELSDAELKRLGYRR